MSLITRKNIYLGGWLETRKRTKIESVETRSSIKLDPDTKLADLLGAIPSSVIALKNFDIKPDGNESRTLEQICKNHGISFDQFLAAMDELDWDQEYRAPH